MSTTTNPSAEFDVREQLARIDRALAETQKFQAETSKFTAEQRKLAAEQDKLSAEAAKLRWDRRLSPYILVASVSSGLVVAVVSHFWR